jgi:hypothetical protein
MNRTRGILLIVLLSLCRAVLPALAEPLPVSGRVTGPDGRALPGAHVALVPLLSELQRGRLALAGQAAPEPAAKAETNEAGGFLLNAPEPGMWVVRVEARGTVPLELRLVPLVDETELPPVRLEADAGLDVLVLGPDRRPRAEALVELVPEERPQAPRFRATWEPAPRTGRTAEDGRVRLPRAAGERVQVRAGLAGQVAEAPAARRVTLQLGSGRERRFRVASQGRPVPGALVLVGEERWPAAVADGEGAFSLFLSPTDPVQLTLLGKDGAQASVTVEPREPGQQAEALRLSPPAPLDGRIVSARDGEPVRGAFLWLGDDPGAFERSRGDGTFQIHGPPEHRAPRPVWLKAAAPGYFPSEMDLGSGRQPPRGLALALTPAVALTGRVLDEGERPVPGAEVRAVYDPATIPMSLSVRRSGGLVRTGATGRFRLGALLEGVAYRLRVSAPGLAPAELAVPPPAPGRPPADVTIILRTGRTVFGRVLGPGDRPLPRVSVRLAPASTEGVRGRLLERREPERRAVFEAATGPDGRFEISSISPGTFDLEASAPGFAPLIVPTLTVPEEAQGPVDFGTVVLAPAVPLRGYVVNVREEPVEGAEIRVSPPDLVEHPALWPMPPDAVTGPDGFFEVPGRRTGEVIALTVTRPGFADHRVPDLRVQGPEPVRIVLPWASSVSGRVVAPDGSPIPGAAVAVDSPPEAILGGLASAAVGVRVERARTDDEGRFAFEGIASSVVHVTASAPGRVTASLVNLELRPGEGLAGLELVLEEGGTLEGEVKTAAGRPAPFATVAVAGVGGFGGGLSAQSDGGGRFILEGVPPGRRLVSARHPVHGRVSREVAILSGTNEVDLVLHGGQAVTGRVTDESGAPVGGARLTLRPERGEWPFPQTVSTEEGAFSFQGISDGTYRLSARREGLAGNGEGEPVVVAGSPVEGLEIRLSTGGAVAGRLLGLDFADLARVRVFAAPGGSPGAVDPDGSYRIAHLPPGEWLVTAAIPGSGLQAEGRVELTRETPEALLDLDLSGGEHSLEGVVLRNGEPLEGSAVVLAGPTGDSRTRRGWTTPSGAFRFSDLVSGDYRLDVWAASGALHREEHVQVPAGERLRIDLRTLEVTGRVFDSLDRSPLAGALVLFLSSEAPEGFVPETRTDSQGGFRLANVPEGVWKIRVTLGGYAPREVEVHIAPEVPQAPVEVGLPPAEPSIP